MAGDRQRQRLDTRHAELEGERRTHEPTWRQICDHSYPYRVVWTKNDVRRGDRRNTTIINSAPVRANRVATSGLYASTTSPGRQWFRLAPADRDLAEHNAVKRFLYLAEERVRWLFARSGWYLAIGDSVFPDLLAIGTGGLISDEHPRSGLRFTPLAIGQFCIDTNADGKVDTVFRRLPMTVRQIVGRFGRDLCSPQVKTAWDRGEYGIVFNVSHAIAPNEEFDQSKADARGKPFSSFWWESDYERGDFLKRSGYHEFPAFFPRWRTPGGSVYGLGSPGMESLGDCKGLQHEEMNLLKMSDKIVDPPMRASNAMRDRRASLNPGDITYTADGQGQIFEPAMEVPPAAIEVVRELKAEDVERIERAYAVELWLSMIEDSRAQRATATEVDARQRESMLQLGPFAERLIEDLLEPAVGRAYATLERLGVLPEAPPELEGQELKIEFLSPLLQAQKLTQLGGIKMVVGLANDLVSMGRKDALDKINVDAMLDEAGDMVGIKPELLLTDDEVKAIRGERAQRESMMQEGEAALAATQGARNLSGIDAAQVAQAAQTLMPAAAAQGGMMPGGGG